MEQPSLNSAPTTPREQAGEKDDGNTACSHDDAKRVVSG